MKPEVAKTVQEKGVKLLNYLRATELSAHAPMSCPREDYSYRYLRLHTDLGMRVKFPDGGPKSGPSEPRPCKLSDLLFI